MKISYKWLKNYINLDLSVKELEKELTFSGIEVEGIETKGEILEQIIVAEIKDRIPHPDSDHLSICKVYDGEEDLQVICGALNCAAGKKVALAPVGAKLGDFKIKKAKLRGEYSFGMLCSERELGISDDHDGIMILNDDLETGHHLSEYYDQSDVIFDVEITPNRADLLGIAGVARDLSALLHKHFRFPKTELPEGKEKIEQYLKLDNQAEELCSRYTARMIKSVKIMESPEWLQNYLKAIGMRPINNVVDITNFVMMEMGHPLHAFDYELVKDHTVVIRRGNPGEKFTDLQDIEHTLTEEDLVIADTGKAIALAGVIGAANSQISTETRNIIIESANFLYSSVRRTSKRLSIFTDSAYRFERDMSDEQAEAVSQRCCQLILMIAGGELVDGKLDSYPKPFQPVIVKLRPARAEKVLSVHIEPEQIRTYLESLGLVLLSEHIDFMEFEVPHYRKDLTREVDLIEELIRLYGYNRIEEKFRAQKIMDRHNFRNRRLVMDSLVNRGFYEVVNWSFSDPADLDKLHLESDDARRDTVELKNPLGSSYSIMRSLLLPDILRNVLTNQNYGQKDLKLFELNKVFQKGEGKLAQESYQLCGVLTGKFEPLGWGRSNREVNFYDVKGIVEEILEIMHLSGIRENKSTECYYQPGTGLDFVKGSVLVASVGKLDRKVCEQYEIEKDCFSFEIYLDAVYEQDRKLIPAYKEIAKYPPVLRDLSILTERIFEVSDIIGTIKGAGGSILSRVVLYDEYKGGKMPPEKRSLTFNLIFSSAEKTLNDEKIGNIMDKIVRSLKKKYGIEMR